MQTTLPTTEWRLARRTLTLGPRTLVMAIVNVTPDSFSDGGRYFSPQAAIDRALQALDEGAAILDLGGESTRPGSHAGGDDPAVDALAEQERLLPVIAGVLQARPDAVISIDTYKAATARAALAAGAAIINDVSGFAWDPAMAAICARARCGVVLMHTRGLPDEWAGQPALPAEEMMADVRQGLTVSLEVAQHAGVAPEAIALAPGYGFGKRFDENFALLARQQVLLGLGRPLLVGLSRKSFLGQKLAPLYGGQPAPVEARETASAAALTASILAGASIVRVHAVRPAVEAAAIADAVRAAQP